MMPKSHFKGLNGERGIKMEPKSAYGIKCDATFESGFLCWHQN